MYYLTFAYIFLYSKICYFMGNWGLMLIIYRYVCSTTPPWWKQLTLVFPELSFLPNGGRIGTFWHGMYWNFMFLIDFTWWKPFNSLSNDNLHWKKSFATLLSMFVSVYFCYYISSCLFVRHIEAMLKNRNSFIVPALGK